MARKLTVSQASRLTGIPTAVIKDAIRRRELPTKSWFRTVIDEDDLTIWRLDYSDLVYSRAVLHLLRNEKEVE